MCFFHATTPRQPVRTGRKPFFPQYILIITNDTGNYKTESSGFLRVSCLQLCYGMRTLQKPELRAIMYRWDFDHGGLMKKIACILAILIALTCIPFGASEYAVGEEGEAERLSATVQMPAKREAEAELLTDGDPLTYVFFKRESKVRFEFSQNAAKLVTVWERDPGEVRLTCYAGDQKLSDTKLEIPFLSVVTELPKERQPRN